MGNKVIMLNTEQREKLEKFAKTGVRSTHLVKRAKVILAMRITS